MDNLKALGRGTQVMFIAAVLLLIVMFFHWQEVDTALGSFGQNAWHGFWGVVMGILTIVLVARIAARLAAVDVPIPLSFATTSFVLGDAHRDLRRPEAPHRRLSELLGVHRRRSSRSPSPSARGSRFRRQAESSRSRATRAALDRAPPRWLPPPQRPTHPRPRLRQRRRPEMPAAADTAHDAAETAASEAPDMASEAADAPSDAADAASDAMSDEPSTERES